MNYSVVVNHLSRESNLSANARKQIYVALAETMLVCSISSIWKVFIGSLLSNKHTFLHIQFFFRNINKLLILLLSRPTIVVFHFSALYESDEIFPTFSFALRTNLQIISFLHYRIKDWNWFLCYMSKKASSSCKTLPRKARWIYLSVLLKRNEVSLGPLNGIIFVEI